MIEPVVKNKLNGYPARARERLLAIRAVIYAVAREDELGEVTESLKWGEPSYTSKMGSPIRMDWKLKNPTQVSVYFNCNTRLVETYREVYQETFQFVGNREIVIPLSRPMPAKAFRACVSMALRYHQIKHLPLLGA
jgi:hypothetical protein